MNPSLEMEGLGCPETWGGEENGVCEKEKSRFREGVKGPVQKRN